MRTVLASTPSEALTTSERVPLSVPTLRGREWAYVKECLDTGWVSSAGPFVERFEREIATYTGSAHAVAVVNGTAGLHVALRVVGVEPEDDVLVPALTFIAPVNAVRYCQAHPVFLDADARTWQMDVDHLARFLAEACAVRDGACYNRRSGRRIRAIMPVHLLGLACDMDRIMGLARSHHLRIVEDAAEAMGVRYRGRHVGTFSDVGVLSFNGNKIITAGGGGMLLTNGAALARCARYLTTQAKDDPVEYIHREIGYNYRLTNLQAAVGLAQLEQLDEFIAKKRAIADAYAAALGGDPEFTLMPSPPGVEPTYWLYTVLLKQGTTVARRQAIIRELDRRGFEARPLWHPIHRLPPYQDSAAPDLPRAMDLYARAISLPSSVGLELGEAQRCAKALQQAARAH